MNKYSSLLVAIVAAIIFSVSADAQSFMAGKVVDVLDGKTVVVAISNNEVRVELEYIDVPGPGHLFYDTVKDHLRGLVLGKMVEYRPRQILKDRTTGKLVLNGVDISQQMLRDGAAWHTPADLSAQETAENDLYASIENTAKNEKRGIWSAPTLASLKPMRPSYKAVPIQQEQKASLPTQTTQSKTPAKPKGKYSDINPALGNIGALLSGYNVDTRTGYVTTSLLGIDEARSDVNPIRESAIDVTYFYKENELKGREGFFVVSVVFTSSREIFLKNNSLILVTDTKNLDMGKPKRTVYREGGNVRELLQYRTNKAMLSMITNDNTVMKVGNHVIQLTGLRYLLYNMLQVAK